MRYPPCLLPCAAVLLSAAVPIAGTAQDPSAPARHTDLGIGLRVGTPGFGLEVAKLVSSHLAARVGVNYFKLSTSKTQSDISYDATLKLQGVSAVLDLYPGRRGSFHFTGGLMTNPARVTATGQPTGGTFKINGNTYTSAQVGTLTGIGKFPGVAPYLGLGFGTPARKARLAFLFDLGAAIGKAKITLNATGATSNPQLASDLRAQQDTTQRDIDKYAKVYPVLSFGLAYRM